jgi:hypothetical protein
MKVLGFIKETKSVGIHKGNNEIFDDKEIGIG